ncbi:CLIP domain-containing serine protease 2-like isoform X2 [Contarinia nasturtii]|uniref:CLIP domain-containing serine protease 2-like isoform X2 n=1 Tax=Contarinia nasturtii TaxID=265458 RepID=UPI0012D3E51A|nr:CLIP domain-containing serine protease 2-like isoform X2 [Contarinia nasturtii]
MQKNYITKLFVLMCFICIANTQQCTTPNNTRGSCINIFRCKVLYDIYQNPFSTNYQQTYLSLSYNKCGGQMVCCPVEENQTTQQVEQPIASTEIPITVDYQSPVIARANAQQCTTSNNTLGSCSDLFRCKVLRDIYQNPLSTKDEQTYLNYSYYYCERGMVCCPVEENQTTPVVSTTLVYPITPFTEFATPTIQYPNDIEQQCTTPDNKPGSCSDLFRCKVLYDIFQNPNPTNDERAYLISYYYNNCEGQKVCCPVEKNQTTSDFTTAKVVPSSQPPPCIPQTTTVSPPRSPGKLPERGTCGIQKSQRFIFDEQAEITEHPWLVLIEYTKPNDEKDFHCGGILINENYVLTAAHCVNNNDIKLWEWRLSGVRLGEWNTTSEPDCENDICSEPVQNIRVVEHITHENYDPHSKEQDADIALLRLERSVNYTDWIQPICLPTSEVMNKSYDRQPLIIGGFGKSETVSGSSLKMSAEISGVPHEECNNFYREYNVTITNKQLCAGGESEKDFCQVDSAWWALFHLEDCRVNHRGQPFTPGLTDIRIGSKIT